MSARDELIGFCLAALPNEQGFAKAERLAAAFRAEVLREAADAVDAAEPLDDYADRFNSGVQWATDEVRRMAAEGGGDDA
ncbi:hypothetical protein ACH4GK_32150 [Streptomyces rimosus]|uniref:hypothetical protein n=1 Tax=Streptomyces rimosus TaxID=1927 RepID=UPI000519B6B5|nr:hypothetical protein [Streptomyces rimosus]